MMQFTRLVQQFMFVFGIGLMLVSCGGADVMPTVTAVSSPPSTSTPTNQPINQSTNILTHTPTAAAQTPTASSSTPTAIPPVTIPDDTLILYATIQNDNWALKSVPPHPAFTSFDDLYGPEIQMEDVRRYTTFNFGPQLSPNGRYLLLPGVGGYGGFEYGAVSKGFWLINLQTGTARQLLPQAKAATWSPYGNEISYVDGDTLYTLSVADGAEPKPIFTHPNLWGLYARWSPDGGTIATITEKMGPLDATGYPELIDTYWLISNTGEQAVELAQRPGMAMEHVSDEMTWSPTGRYLLVRNEVFDVHGVQLSPDLMGRAHWLPVWKLLEAGESELLLVNGRSGLTISTISGTEVTRITDTYVDVWAFSHDGRFLAYVDPSTKSSVIVFNLQTYQTEQFTISPIDVQTIHWSANSDVLLLDNGFRTGPIWSLALQPGSKPQVLLTGGTLIDALPLPEMEVVQGTAVSIPTVTPPPSEPPTPQNPVILFAHDDDLWRIGLSDEQAERLTENGALGWGMTQGGDDWRINALSVPPQVSQNGRYVAFSPDGNTILLLDTKAPGQLRRIDPGTRIPSWSPNSRYLAYGAGGKLIVYDVENDVLHQLLDYAPQVFNVSWSPDMRYLAFNCCFVRPEGYSTADFGEIRRVELSTGQVEIVDVATLTIGGGTSSLCWNQSGQVVKRRDMKRDEMAICSYDRFAAGSSPDGKQRATLSPSSAEDVFWEGDSLLTIREVDSGEVVWQQQISGHAANAQWSPDGTAIIFQRGTAFENNLSIWQVASASSSNPTQIIESGFLIDVAVQP